MTNRRRLESCRRLWRSGQAQRYSYQNKNTKLRNNSDFGFHGFIWVERAGAHPGFN